MIIHKCDSCKKKIKPDEAIHAGIGWKEFSFCVRCGEPVAKYLKKRGLLKTKKK